MVGNNADLRYSSLDLNVQIGKMRYVQHCQIGSSFVVKVSRKYIQNNN